MLSLPHGFFLAFWAISGVLALTYCPVGYSNLYGDKCYKMLREEMNWTNARALCQRDGGDLVSIHSQLENYVIQAALPSCCAYWIGLKCNSNHEFVWSDGTPRDYINIKSSRGYVKPCNSSQAVYFRQADGVWAPDVISYASPYVICEVGGSPITTTTPPPSECGFGYQLLDGNSGMCVRISDKLTTWMEAEAECQLDGAHLASIHSKQINDYIRRLALSQRLVNAIFIGITMDSQTNAVSWSDGSDMDYSNFDPGMPNALFGGCGAMQTGNLGGEWTSVFCDDSNKLPFACSKPQAAAQASKQD